MSRLLLCAAGAALFLVTTRAAAGPPDAAKVRLAGEEYDAGALAYKNKEFEVAASHFEAADAAVPSAKVLRFAIRARSEAGQGSRAATLAALALARHGDDPETVKLARETLEKTEPLLHKVSVSCAPPCVLAVGTRAVPGEATTRWTVYLDPGKASISASFFGNTSAQKDIDAKAGGASDIRLEPAEAGNPAAAAPPPATSGDKPAVDAPAEPPDGPAPDAAAADTGSGLPPIVFIGGLVATAALGGVTIWSGVDTKNNPGPDAVRSACAGQGTSCPEYQDGLAKETRTNVLLGATAGVAVITGVVGLFLTNWGGKPTPPSSTSAFVAPTGAIFEGGAALGARGAF